MKKLLIFLGLGVVLAAVISAPIFAQSARRVQTVFPIKRGSHQICIMGTSSTDTLSLGVEDYDFWPCQLEEALTNNSCSVVCRSFAKSGCKSSNVGQGFLNRAKEMNDNGTPDLAILSGFENDVGQAIGATNMIRSGTTVTVYATAHGLLANELVTISGATETAYNGTFAVATVADANTFTYTAASTPSASPASGSPRFDNPTTLNCESMALYMLFGARGCVTAETSLPATEPPGTRYVVQMDNGVNGGPAAAANQGLKATIVGPTTNAVTVWECALTGAGTNCWRRIGNLSTAGDRCTKVLVSGPSYLNFSSGGDNGATEYAPWDSVTGIRYKLATAVAAMSGANPGVVWLDIRTDMLAAITSGQFTQGDFGWEVADSNVHNNAKGHTLWKNSIYAKIYATWGLGFLQ